MIKFYNTLTKKKDALKPITPNKVGIFVCGSTVYDSPHLGHARCCVFYDALVKYLKFSGYDVFYLQNITDIDDKIINRAHEKKITPEKLAENYEKEYLQAMKVLRVDSVSKYARATEHIKEMISQIQRLFKKDYGYKIEDGIYYDIKKFKGYGKLSGRTVLQANDAVSRIDETIGKRSRGDFCLWKFSKPKEPSWNSPWGKGRPGWHIEDTAIAEKYLGLQYDIHGGGKDLIFPHHEDEIAQMEAISGLSPMVKYWMHVGFLTVAGSKMSKSLNNFITINDFLKSNSWRLLRLFFLKTHYRSPVDYTDNNIHQTQKELEKIDDFIARLKNQAKNGEASKFIESFVAKSRKDFYKILDNDMNTPSAMAVIFKLINQGNQIIDKDEITFGDAKEIIKFLKEIDSFLCFIFEKETKVEIPEAVKKIVKEREKARKNNNWQKSDELKKEIEKMGYRVEDTKQKTIVKKNF